MKHGTLCCMRSRTPCLRTVDPEADSVVIRDWKSEVPEVLYVYGGESSLQFHHRDPSFGFPKTSLVGHAFIHRVIPPLHS
jgi:hypothetical protein